jgi:hypothetical protein
MSVGSHYGARVVQHLREMGLLERRSLEDNSREQKLISFPGSSNMSKKLELPVDEPHLISEAKQPACPRVVMPIFLFPGLMNHMNEYYSRGRSKSIHLHVPRMLRSKRTISLQLGYGISCAEVRVCPSLIDDQRNLWGLDFRFVKKLTEKNECLFKRSHCTF